MKRIPNTDRVKVGLKEAITLLCKTGLTFESELSIEGLLGITLDQNEVFLVNIKEVIKNPMDFHVSSSDNTQENHDFLVGTKHLSGSDQLLSSAENEIADKNESDVDDKSEIQCHSYRNEWKPSDSDETMTELDDVISNRSTASVATTTEGNGMLQMKPIISHVWDDTGLKTVGESSMNLMVQQRQEIIVQRETHKVDSDETLDISLNTEEGNQNRTWQSSSMPAMPINLTQKHKLPATKSASVNRPMAMSSHVDQQADNCEETKPKRCRTETANHSATSRQDGRFPEEIIVENRPNMLTTDEGGSTHTSVWLPSVSISEVSSEVIIVKEEPANEETPELARESHHSSPSSALGRDWLKQRTEGTVSSSASNISVSPYNEPDAHARWLQNIAAHVQGLRGPTYGIPCSSMVHSPQPLMGLLSTGKGVSTASFVRESATFAPPLITKPFHSDATGQRRHYHKKGGPMSSATMQTSCVNCATITTTMWRRDTEGQPVCNACGLYYKLHQVAPPHFLPQRTPRRLDQKCTNCGITATTAWRRNPDGKTVCNACGLYYKLYKVNRPLSMVKGEIHSRRRKPKGNPYSSTDDNIPGPTFGSSDT